MLPGQNGNSCTSVETRKTSPARRSSDGCRPQRARRRCRRSAPPRKRAPQPARRRRCAAGAARSGRAACRARSGAASRAPAARARRRGRERTRRRLRREKASRPITASSTTMMTPPKARIMCSKRAGTFTNGSCSSHDHDQRDREHDLLGHDRAGERRGGHVGAHELEPALQHRDARDLAEARGQQRVEQEADEERRHDVRVVEARLARDRVERRLPDDGLEQDREQVERRATRSPTTRRRRPRSRC